MARHLTEGERRRLAIVEAHLAAVSTVTRNPKAIVELETLLSDDFTWQTPSTDAARGVRRDRATYLAMLAEPSLLPEPQRFVELEVKLLASTVEDFRIAGETVSNGLRRDGIRYSNRYHQLWCFDTKDRITEYRIYADTENIAATHAAGIALIARGFLDCLVRANAQKASDLLDESLRWLIREGMGGERTLDRAAGLAYIARKARPGLVLLADGLLAHGDRVMIEAIESTGAWRQLSFFFKSGRIAEIHDYRTPARHAA